MARKILVTGGAGFIGSHVCHRLADAGDQILVLDDFSSGKASRLDRLSGKCRIHLGDVRDTQTLLELLPGVDGVIHLAAEPSVQRSIACPEVTHSVNFGGTLAILEAMRKTGIKKVLYASSAAVYPSIASEPHSEATMPRPSSPYGLDKLAGEHILRIYKELHGFSATALRFFNVYGEGQDSSNPYSGVISRFIDAMAHKHPVTIFGTGKQCRDFVYAGDIARVISDLLDRDDLPDVMNVATGTSTTLLELVATVQGIIGDASEVRHLPARAGDILESKADVSRLRSSGIEPPQTTLSEGLKRTIAP